MIWLEAVVIVGRASQVISVGPGCGACPTESAWAFPPPEPEVVIADSLNAVKRIPIPRLFLRAIVAVTPVKIPRVHALDQIHDIGVDDRESDGLLVVEKLREPLVERWALILSLHLLEVVLRVQAIALLARRGREMQRGLCTRLLVLG